MSDLEGSVPGGEGVGPLAWAVPPHCHLDVSNGDETNVSAHCRFLVLLLTYKLSSHMLLYFVFSSNSFRKGNFNRSAWVRLDIEGMRQQSTRFQEAASSISSSQVVRVWWPTKIWYGTRDEGLWPFVKT